MPPGWIASRNGTSAALYAGQMGVPAIFPRARFRELADLRGDIGARMLLQRNPDRVVRVPMESAALDIDTPEDLLALDSTLTGKPT